MSAREWKPGDVALLSSVNGEEAVGFAVGVGEVNGWRTEDGRFWGPRYTHLARSLVVIDPEDREQVERLLAVIDSNHHETRSLLGPIVNRVANMKAALREFANPKPPRPEEPKWLGAVVEDEEGRRWLRWWAAGHGQPHPAQDRPWSCANGGGSDRRYEDINAIRVLSEGVQAGESR